jgi:hypothetical protein
MSLTEILFRAPDIQKASESGDAMDPLGEAQEVLIMNYDTTVTQESDDEDSALDKNGDGYAAAKSDDEILFKAIPQRPMINQTRSKS